jgi:pSer/pThr/pTyr-binding forkhead associated (FHA) protein
MLRLVGTDGQRMYTFELRPGSHTIGRDSQQPFHVPDKTVSRSHAVIEVSPSFDEIYLTDAGSHNGTTINGVRITSRQPVAIGDKIMFGRTEFRLTEEMGLDEPTSRPTAAVMTDNNLEKSVVMSIDDALQTPPTKVTELPELFPTLSEMARMLVLPEPREVMLERSLTLVNKIIPAERLAVLMTTEDTGEIYAAATLLPGGKDPGQFNLSQTVVNEILTQRNAILINDPKSDPRFAQQQSIIMSDLRCAMAAPLFDEGDVLGILYVDTSNLTHRYDDDCLRLLATFGNIIASRLQNYMLIHEREQKQIYESELRRASAIQQNLLIGDIPEVPGYAVHAFQEQCRAVGGDLYEVATLSDGRVVLLVADVSGKGMGAALLMANILASFRILYSVTEFTLGDVVNLVSKELFHSSAPSDFATLFIAVLDPKTHVVRYINAGHNPPLLVRHDGSREYLDACGTMIGAFDFGDWRNRSGERGRTVF